MSKIAKSAIIEDGAIIGEDVEIADFCFVSKDAKIGNRTKIAQGACIYGNTTIGEGNRIFSYAVVGSIPQDLKYNGERVKLIIGNNNTIREFTLINPGTLSKNGIGKTVIGDNNLLMGYVHVAHDCIIGNGTILANGATLAGHVEVGDFAVIGGLTPVHQFVTIGEYAMLAGASAISQDIPPYCLAEGNRAIVKSLNMVGIRRHFSRADVDELRGAFKAIFRSNRIPKEVAKEYLESSNEKIRKLSEFIISSKRGIPTKKSRESEDEEM